MDRLEKIIKYSKKFKVLYVEDNKEARESTKMIFDEFFKETITAVNGKDGYEKFSSEVFDLIITDINMPKENGLEMIKKIRKSNSNIPILVLSAYNKSDFFMESIKLNVDGYLLKPIDIEQLLDMIDKIIQKLKLINNAKTNLHLLNEYKEVTNKSAIISKTDPKGIITYVNEEFCKISGYRKDELIGKNHNIVRHPNTPKTTFKNMWDTIKNKKKIWKGIVRNLSKNGKSYYVDATIKPILDTNGNIIEYIASRHIITDIMNPKKQLDDAIKNSKEPIVIYIKLEDFNTLEEFYDNETIETIQDKTKIYLEKEIIKICNFDKIYQLGNGGFALIIEKSRCAINMDYLIKQLKDFQEKTNKDVIDIGNIDYDISIIISLAYQGTRRLESAKLGIKELLKTKCDFIVSNNFASIKKEQAKKNMKTILMIKKAINEHRIVSYFQPIINNKTKKIEKYESLVRLIDENGQVLSPFFFLNIAKKGKYYSQITNIVLKNSFEVLKNINTDISINLSALDIEDNFTRECIFNLLKENKKNTSRVIFELLEDENVKNFQTIKLFIYEIKKFGVKIAIDDFGAGYSNFERLLGFQPDILKIDGCLIKDITTNNYSLSVVKNIVSFAKEQNMQTVAEYIENEKIYNLVKDIGIDFSQGYYFGKPLSL